MKILYVAPLIPSPSGNGGRRAALNHLRALQREGIQVHAVLIDVEGTQDSLTPDWPGMTSHVFRREIPSAGSGLGAKLRGAFQFLVNGRPRSAAVVRSSAARRHISRVLAEEVHDAIVVDHLNAYSLVEHVSGVLPTLYIAHNIEADVLDQFTRTFSKYSALHWLIALDAWKMKRYERRLIGKASSIALISAGDASSPVFREAASRIFVWPELPDLKGVSWKPLGNKSILFVGSAKYFPNRDAINWMVRDLMPRLRSLDPTVTLRIAGTSAAELDFLNEDLSGIHLEGYVSDSRLEELHVTSTLMVSPVVLGSGIKIKVLEAAAYGLPVAATEASLQGIDFLKGAAVCFDRGSPDSAAQCIYSFLTDSERLISSSQRSRQQLMSASADRGSLLRGLDVHASQGLR